MITQVKDFISTILDDVRLTTFVTGKVAGDWTSGAPFYFYGTPIEVSNRISKQKNGVLKFPAVFLFEPFNVNENEDLMVSVGASPTVRMFFMNDWYGKQSWNTEDHYTNIIADMDELKREFIKNLKKHKHVLKVDTYNTTRHVKWGLFIANKGNKNPIFNEQLSGVELEITFDIDKIIDGCNLFD